MIANTRHECKAVQVHTYEHHSDITIVCKILNPMTMIVLHYSLKNDKTSDDVGIEFCGFLL